MDFTSCWEVLQGCIVNSMDTGRGEDPWLFLQSSTGMEYGKQWLLNNERAPDNHSLLTLHSLPFLHLEINMEYWAVWGGGRSLGNQELKRLCLLVTLTSMSCVILNQSLSSFESLDFHSEKMYDRPFYHNASYHLDVLYSNQIIPYRPFQLVTYPKHCVGGADLCIL